MQKKLPVVVVVGASSGLGNFAAMYLAKRAFQVYGTSRQPEKYQKKADEFFELIALDADSDESVAQGLETIIEREGSIDALIYAAGTWLSGSLEDSSLEEARQIFETNFFGAVRLSRSVIKGMRDSGGGRIIFVSGVSARLSLPFQGLFCASKAALEAYADSLRIEVKDTGIQVILVEPGDFMSLSPSGRKTVQNAFSEFSAYRGAFDRTLAIIAHDEVKGSSPVQFARTILKTLVDPKPKHRYKTGSGYVLELEKILRFLPSAWADFLITRYYGI